MKLLVILLSVVTLGSGAAAQSPVPADANAAARTTLGRIEKLRKERPGDGVLVFYDALVRISLGERGAALDLLNSLKGRKLGLIPVRNGGFDAVWKDPKFNLIRQELEAEEPKTPAAPVAFRLTDPKLIPEGIAYDPLGKRFFIGSIAERKIIVTDEKGSARDFSKPSDKLDGILGLFVDSAHGRLYAVSTNGAEESAKTERRNAVVCYDLRTGGLTGRLLAKEATQLNDLTVAPDATLYVTDSASSTLFRRKSDETALTVFGQTGNFRGANGIALSPDGKLYVTLSTGIAEVDTSTGEPTRLPQPDTVVTGGCDGLYWHDGNLFGIQNTTNPGRVVMITLADNGTKISGLSVLQSHHHPKFDEPTTGAVANDALYVIGNSYVGHYQPDGSIQNAEELKGTAIIAVPLRR